MENLQQKYDGKTLEYIEQMESLRKFNDIDEKILKEILKNKNNGTIELSKIIGIAPKNLIPHLNKMVSCGLIQKSKIKQTPKGWKRLFIPGEGAELYIKMRDDSKKSLAEFSKKLLSKLPEQL